MITLAHVAGSFGLKGFVKLKIYTECLDSVVQYDPILLINGDTVLQTSITDHFIKNDVIFVQFKNINNRDTADALRSYAVCIKEDQLPTLPEGEFYWNDLLGFAVTNKDGNVLGYFDSLCAASATDILVIKAEDNREILIPFVPDVYVLKIDQKQKQIIVDWEEISITK